MNQIIGVLWKKEKDGMHYFSGVLNDLRGKINIAVFPNNKKEAENQPDMNIVISWGQEEDSEKNGTMKVAEKPKSSKRKKKTDDDEVGF